jgi:parallel beta-helix repeat protein
MMRSLFSTRRFGTLGNGKAARRCGYRPTIEALEERAVPTTLTVPSSSYPTIQSAINAAHNSGDTINVNPGTYQEQLTIPSRFSGLTINSVTKNAAIIQAPATMTSGLQAIVEVQGATGVTINGFEITGQTAGANELAGIYVDGSGQATIQNNWITHLQSNNDSGIGVLVGNLAGRHGNSTQGTAAVNGNTIDNYGKGGVVVVNKGSNATIGTITGNTITGIGSTTAFVQYGIQISNGATGQVKSNTVTGNVYNDPTGSTQAAGILIYSAGSNVVVSNNDLGTSAGALPNGSSIPYSNDVGIWLIDAPGATVSNNDINETKYDGIVLDSLGSSSGVSTVSNNNVFYSAGDGLLIYNTSGATISNNSAEYDGNSGIWLALNDTSDTISNNLSVHNGTFGLLVADYDANNPSLEAYLHSSTSTGNKISQNTLTSNNTTNTTGVFDAEDFSTGTKTAHTGNTWNQNTIGTKSPTGLQ